MSKESISSLHPPLEEYRSAITKASYLLMRLTRVAEIQEEDTGKFALYRRCLGIIHQDLLQWAETQQPRKKKSRKKVQKKE